MGTRQKRYGGMLRPPPAGGRQVAVGVWGYAAPPRPLGRVCNEPYLRCSGTGTLGGSVTNEPYLPTAARLVPVRSVTNRTKRVGTVCNEPHQRGGRPRARRSKGERKSPESQARALAPLLVRACAAAVGRHARTPRQFMHCQASHACCVGGAVHTCTPIHIAAMFSKSQLHFLPGRIFHYISSL